MAKARYKKIFEEIWNKNKELFQQFFVINSQYENPKERKALENDFQEIGKQVKDLLQKGENDLCRQMEKSEHRSFSSNLADKYWDEIRKYFKFIDLVGVISK